MNSEERVDRLIHGKSIDRIPIFDLLRNEAAIEHYTGKELTLNNAEDLVFEATDKVLDGTRPSVKCPVKEKEEILPDGRKRKIKRWTVWTERLKFDSVKEYKLYLRKNYIDKKVDKEDLKSQAKNVIENHCKLKKNLNDIFIFSIGAGVGLMRLHTEVGLDQFSLYMYDCPDIISEALESITVNCINRLKLIKKISEDIKIKPKGVFLGEDIAFKESTMFSPEYLRKEFFPRLKRIIDVCHEADWKVMFHSDGYLMNILDELVEAGIDLINPVEVAAGMDIKEIHQRYPDLIMAGGIDVSTLLPYGSIHDVKDAVKKAIEDSEGQIMVGSSTEMNNNVPLENVITMYDTVKNYKY